MVTIGVFSPTLSKVRLIWRALLLFILILWCLWDTWAYNDCICFKKYQYCINISDISLVFLGIGLILNSVVSPTTLVHIIFLNSSCLIYSLMFKLLWNHLIFIAALLLRSTLFHRLLIIISLCRDYYLSARDILFLHDTTEWLHSAQPAPKWPPV